MGEKFLDEILRIRPELASVGPVPTGQHHEHRPERSGPAPNESYENTPRLAAHQLNKSLLDSATSQCLPLPLGRIESPVLDRLHPMRSED